MTQIEVDPFQLTLVQIFNGRVMALPLCSAVSDSCLVELLRVVESITSESVVLGEPVGEPIREGSSSQLISEPASSGRVILSESSYRRGSSPDRELLEPRSTRSGRRLYRGSNWARADALGKNCTAHKTTCYRPRELPRQCARKSTWNRATAPILLKNDIKIERTD